MARPLRPRTLLLVAHGGVNKTLLAHLLGMRRAHVGRLTSGGYSVAFGKSIGMGYVKPELAKVGQKLKVKMLNQLWGAEIVEDSPYDPTNATIRVDG